MLRIYKITYLWVKPNAALPSSITELSKAINSLVQDYRNSFKLPIDIPIGPHQTRKYSGVYSVHLTKRKKILLKLWGSHPLQFFKKKNYVAKVFPL